MHSENLSFMTFQKSECCFHHGANGLQSQSLEAGTSPRQVFIASCNENMWLHFIFPWVRAANGIKNNTFNRGHAGQVEQTKKNKQLFHLHLWRGEYRRVKHLIFGQKKMPVKIHAAEDQRCPNKGKGGQTMSEPKIA